jgi:hypothetical protein
MSNVLIGIIGVILFIGLALAGALILGDDFKSANNDSKAAAVQSQLKQVADAVNMAVLKTGRPVMAGQVDVNSALLPRFLRSAPVNPIGSIVGGSGFILISADGSQVTTQEAKTAIMYMKADTVSKSVCEAIDRMLGRTKDNEVFDVAPRSFVNSQMVGQAGCMHNGAAFIAFQKI